MPIPRLDDATIEFEFTKEEAIAGRSLDPNKIAWLQTKYAMLWKLRNSTPVPEDSAADRSYFLKIAEIDGRMSMIQELLDDHKAAMKEVAELSATGQVIVNSANPEAAVAQRAAQLVHRIQTS